jgi:hypothetical protein
MKTPSRCTERLPTLPLAVQTLMGLRLQPLVSMKPRTSRDDPQFMSTFFKVREPRCPWGAH